MLPRASKEHDSIAGTEGIITCSKKVPPAGNQVSQHPAVGAGGSSTGPIERTPLLQDPDKVSRSYKNPFALPASLLQAQSVFSMPEQSAEEDWGGMGGTGAAFPSLQGSLPTHRLSPITHHVDEDVKQPDELKGEPREGSGRVSVRKGSRRCMWEEWPWRRWGRGRAQLRWVLRLEWEVLKVEWGWLLVGLGSVYMGAVASNGTHLLTASHPPFLFPSPNLANAPLPDVLHSLLGQWPRSLLPLYPLCVALLCGLCYALLPLAQVLFHLPPRLYPPVRQWLGLKGHDSLGYVIKLPVPCVLVWRRLSQSLVIAHTLRAAAILLTLVPSVSPSCRGLSPPSPSSLPSLLLDPSHALGSSPACSSLLLSSSAIHCLLALLLVHTYFPGLSWPLLVLLWGLGLCAMLLCLGLRGCYSSGVVLGLYVGATAWALTPTPTPHTLEDTYGLRVDVWLRDEEGGVCVRLDEGEAGYDYTYLPVLPQWGGPIRDCTQAQAARLSLPW